MGMFDAFSSVPIIGGLFGSLSGEPTKIQTPAYQPNEASFQTTPEQKQYLDYLASNVYNPRNESPSAAQGLLQQSTNQNMNQLTGAIGSTRGVQNPALLARQAANVASNVGQQAVNQAAVLKAQEGAQGRAEDMSRQQLLGSTLAGQNAGQQELEKLRANISIGQQQLETQAAEAAKNRQSQTMGGLGQIGATLGAAAMMAPLASDINVKKNIAPADAETQNFLDLQYRKMMNELEPYTYNYKNEKYGSGPQLGVMAQDLEKSPAGKQMVAEKDGKKMIVPNVGTILGAQANLNERLNKLEGQGMNESPQGYLDYLANQNAPQMIKQGPNAIQMPPIDLVGTVPVQATPAPAVNQGPRMQKIIPSPMEAPVHIQGSPIDLPGHIPSAPVAPQKIDPTIQNKLDKIQSLSEQQNKMQYLDFLMKNYQNIGNAFTKNYNQLG
jgi:hypothetical protein